MRRDCRSAARRARTSAIFGRGREDKTVCVCCGSQIELITPTNPKCVSKTASLWPRVGHGIRSTGSKVSRASGRSNVVPSSFCSTCRPSRGFHLAMRQARHFDSLPPLCTYRHRRSTPLYSCSGRDDQDQIARTPGDNALARSRARKRGAIGTVSVP